MNNNIKTIMVLLFCSGVVIFSIMFSSKLAFATEQQLHTFEINPALPKYKIILYSSNRLVNKIEIFEAGSSTPKQVIKDFDPEAECETLDDPVYKTWLVPTFEAEDINFDEYKDLKLLCSVGAAGNSSYIYWIFNKKSGQFEFLKGIILYNPTLWPKRKEIQTHINEGSAGLSYSSVIYKSIRGKLVLIKEINQIYRDDKGYFVRTVKELKNGKVFNTREEIVKIPQERE